MIIVMDDETNGETERKEKEKITKAKPEELILPLPSRQLLTPMCQERGRCCPGHGCVLANTGK